MREFGAIDGVMPQHTRGRSGALKSMARARKCAVTPRNKTYEPSRSVGPAEVVMGRATGRTIMIRHTRSEQAPQMTMCESTNVVKLRRVPCRRERELAVNVEHVQ